MQIGQAVSVGFKSLFSLVHTPYPDTLFDEPLNYKRSFVRFASKTVEHEYRQNIELALLRLFLDEPQLVPVIGADLIAGHASFLFLAYDDPAHFFGKLPVGFALHRDIRLIQLVMVHLLGCGNTI